MVRVRRHQHPRGSTAILLITVVLVVGAVVGAIWYFMQGKTQEINAPILHVASKGPFDNVVLEQGEVESSSNIEIRCEVKSRNTAGTQIISVVTEGTQVKKGDIIIRLDSSALERERDQQKIVCNTSESVMINAENVYEAALVAKVEYLEGAFKQEEQLVNSEIFFAEQNLRTAQLSFKSAERLAAKGIVNSLQLEGDKFAVDKAQTELDKGHTRLRVLSDYTKPKMLRQFDSDIASAKAKWDAERSSLELERKKLKDIEDQVAKCEIRAPADGQVVYANVSNNRGGSSEFVVEAGVNVREGQVIVRLPDPNQMQVKAKINESRVTLVRAGMPVLVRLDAFGDKVSHGEVTKVNQYAEPGSWISSQVKEYATFIKIADPPDGIRPGLTAEVRIFVEQLPDALQLPVQAIFEHGADTYCVVRTGGAGEKVQRELRKVKVGSSNDKFVTITDGLKEKEVVVMDPRKYIDKDELPKVEHTQEQLVSNVKAGPGGNAAPGGAAPGGAAPGGAAPGGAASGGAAPGSAAPGAGRGPGTTVAAGGGPGGPGGGEPGAGGPGAGGPGGPGGGQRKGGGNPEQMFARMDANGDGKVSADEMSGMPENFRGRFMQNDTNGDGAVDREEFTAGAARMRQQGGAGGGGPGGPGGGAPGGAP